MKQFQNLTYKQKNKFLLYGSILATVLLYSLFISDTLEIRAVCSSLREQLEQAQGAPEKVLVYEQKLKEMEKQLGLGSNSNTNSGSNPIDSSSGDVQQALLSTVTNYCQNNTLILREFPSTVQIQENDFNVQTNVFVVEGGFIKLLKLIYLLEQGQSLGKLSSVDFQSRKDYKTQTFALTAKVFIQNLKRQKI